MDRPASRPTLLYSTTPVGASRWPPQSFVRYPAQGTREVAVTVVALDLERTLVDNAISGRPRPGLRDFLAFCDGRFGRVVMYTTVGEADAREVMADLAGAGHVPPTLFDRLEYVGWSGEHKDLSFVRGAVPADILLVDDDAGWIRPDQRDRWIPIIGWDGGPDSELLRVWALLLGRLAGREPRESGSAG